MPWLLEQHPAYRDRILRTDDLRFSILETLRRDLPNAKAPFESALARFSIATKTAVRKALAALELEGEITIGESPTNDHERPVRLGAA